ncbi:hypothetical protein STANM309S_06465 [Streptomyces tanashiensis]
MPWTAVGFGRVRALLVAAVGAGMRVMRAPSPSTVRRQERPSAAWKSKAVGLCGQALGVAQTVNRNSSDTVECQLDRQRLRGAPGDLASQVCTAQFDPVPGGAAGGLR